MSETGDRTLAALTREWQSTAQIASKVEPSRGVGRYTHTREVYYHLSKEVRRGVAEMKVEHDAQGRSAFWRLRP